MGELLHSTSDRVMAALRGRLSN